jgi:methyl-accepting chemotaxis protein
MKYLKNKLMLYISSILVLTVASLTVISSLLYYRSTTVQAEQYSSYLAAAYQQGINSVLNTYRNDIKIVAAKSFLTDGTTSAQQQSLLSDEAKAIGFHYFVVADAQGSTGKGGSVADKPFFQQAKAGSTFLSDPTMNASKQLVLYAATPIGTTGKVLYGELPYDALSKELNRIKIGESGYAFVINRAGLTVIHPELANVEKPTDYLKLSQTDSSYVPIANIYRQMIAGKTGTGYSVYKGVRRLVAYAPLSGPEGWSAAVTTPVNQLDEGLRSTLEICVGVGLALALIAILITRIFALKITEPIVRATRRIESLAEGDLQEVDEPVKGKDESARLVLALQNTVHSLRSYIMDISHVLDRVAAKDLTAESTVTYTGDFVSVQSSLEKIVKSLNATLNGIAQSTEQVRIGSEQVALGGQNLAESSTEQASTTERLMNSLALVSDRIHENAEYSLSMQNTAQSALTETAQGNEEMGKMLQSMESIDSFSKKIQGIIHLIDDIAFQTNILALNAAVEASRAGEAGRGFSVVADEVRQLASKSAEAAKNTAELIEATIQSVGQGMQNAEKTADAFRKIVGQTNDMNNLVLKMSASLKSQSQSITELNEGMKQISVATQSNSATAEESAATSEELLSQAQTLNEMVAEFKTT